MNKLFILSAAVAVLGTTANAFTLATFDDPSNGSVPMFTVTGSSVSGSWLGSGLNLKIPATSSIYNNVKMDMASVTRTGTNLGSGMVSFWDTDQNNPLFTISFDSAVIFEPFGTAGSYLNSNNVTFGGSAIASLGVLDEEQFSFSFANPTSGQNGNTYTASMTSSAVPEPASMIALGLGLAALGARRKKA